MNIVKDIASNRMLEVRALLLHPVMSKFMLKFPIKSMTVLSEYLLYGLFEVIESNLRFYTWLVVPWINTMYFDY